MNTTTPIFISYKRKDWNRVSALKDDIEQKLGVKCWIDTDGIETQQQFRSKICSAIDRADVVLLFHSRNHLNIDFENDWTIKELNYAQDKAVNKPVKLVLLDDAPLKNVFLFEFGSKSNTDSNDPVQWDILIRDLRNLLHLPETQPTAKPEPKPRVVPQPAKPVTPAVPSKLYARRGHNGLWGFADENHRLVIPCMYDAANDFYEGVASVKKGDMWGMIDVNENVIVGFNYKELGICSQNRVRAVNETLQEGFIDREGNTIVPFGLYFHCGPFSEGRANVQLLKKAGLFSKENIEKVGFIDLNGNIVVEPQYDKVFSEFNEGLTVVRKGRTDPFVTDYVIDHIGRQKFTLARNKLHYFYFQYSEGMLRFVSKVSSTQYQFGFYNKQGELVIPYEYNEAWDFHEGLAAVQRMSASKIRFINTKGSEVNSIKSNFLRVKYGFSDGLCPVLGVSFKQKMSGGWGLIDKSGNLVVPYQFDEVGNRFIGGLMAVKKDEEQFYIDHEGRRVDF